MKLEISLSSKSGKYEANGIFDGKSVTVQKGGRINPNFAQSIRGGKLSKKYREDKSFVSEHYEILKDCTFKSPSTSAQFVTGRSVDGYNAWKVSSGQCLGDYLKSKGLR